MTRTNNWWGRHTVRASTTSFWQIGPLRLWVENAGHVWQISSLQNRDWLEPNIRVTPELSLSDSAAQPPSEARTISCVFGEATASEISITPLLGDRSFVTRLRAPLQIMANETVELYIVTPLWLRIKLVHDGRAMREMQELALFRPSDTWFGPVSHEGELCYSSQAPAYFSLSNVPLRLHCAITAVSIRNSDSDALNVDRFTIPLPRLSIFYSPTTGFWTDRISLERNDDREMAAVQLDHRPPTDAQATQFVGAPRISPESNNAIRAFSTFFKDRG